MDRLGWKAALRAPGGVEEPMGNPGSGHFSGRGLAGEAWTEGKGRQCVGGTAETFVSDRIAG